MGNQHDSSKTEQDADDDYSRVKPLKGSVLGLGLAVYAAYMANPSIKFIPEEDPDDRAKEKIK